ncbi:MAG: dephospho-CoA kinase [Pirellulaceae bacterium]|nr:dephospho-CoA kinase [Pirellulaceae bacterium]
MLIVGIAGGIASGKSMVSTVFKEQGAFVLDADQVGHQVLTRSEVRNQIRKLWGDLVFRDDDSVNREKLGAIVFDPLNGALELSRLERITHPLIRQCLEDQVRKLISEEEFSIAVLDAPVMFKAGWDGFCDRLIFVDSSLETRQSRAMVRGWTISEFETREAAQVSLDVKRSRSDWLIQNDGTPAELKERALAIWDEFISLD